MKRAIFSHLVAMNEQAIYLATIELEELIKKVIRVQEDNDIIRKIALLGEYSAEAKSIKEALKKGFTKEIRLLAVTVLTRDVEGNLVEIVDNDVLGRVGKVSNTIAVALATAKDVKATETESQKQRVNQAGKG